MARRLIKTVQGLGNEAKVYIESDWNEFVVIPNGDEAASYHTDDKQDAINTAEVMCGLYKVA